MGYRSDIYLAIREEDYNLLIASFNEKYAGGTWDEAICPDDIDTKPNGVIVIKLEYRKWYEGEYPDVDAFMAVLHENLFPWKYVRIGEDWEDIDDDWFDDNDELKGCFCYSINVSWC